MRSRVVWVLGLSMATIAGLQACGSDSSGSARDANDAGGGKGGGSGAKGTGNAGTSATPEAGGAGLGCDTTPCEGPAASLSSLLGASTSIATCCLSDTTCGIDTSALGQLLGGAQLPACTDPSALVTPPMSPVRILDGGIIEVGDGGDPILLDGTCPDITSALFDLPGCCRPSGTCGGSTHTLDGAGTTVPLRCDSYDDVAAASASQFGNAVVVPDDPKIKCDYTLGHPEVTEAGAGSTPEAAPPEAPDGGAPRAPDAGAARRPDAAPPGTAAPADAAPPPRDAATH